MSRLAAISAALLFFAAPALAAPVTFTVSESRSSIEVSCPGPSRSKGDDCGIEAEVDFNRGDDRRLDPSATFRFLKFEVDDSKDENDDDEDEDKRAGAGGTFFAEAKLAFRINTVWYSVMTTGMGAFTTRGEGFTSFFIAWNPITDVVVQGVGTLAVAFEDLELRAPGNRRSAKVDELYVNATISAVPLPAGPVLLLSGLALLGAARMRRRALS